MRSLTSPPYLTGRARPLTAVLLFLALAAVLAAAPGARAAGVLDIRGGGDGHGIGMSQYGAYGYALHRADYRTILAHYYEGTQIAGTNPRQIVRVLLGTGSASFSGATRAGSVRLNPAVTYTVTTAGGGLQLKPSPGGGRGHKKPRTFRAPLTVSGSAPLTVPGTGTYRGSLVFSPSGGGVQTVNAVGLDDYVRGVVAAEMPASWPAAALEAQAVAARTYAITTTVNGAGYNLYDDTRSQMYGGVGAETAATDAAVAATQGQVVTYNGQPAVTYFFASSGGHTESIQNVWPGSTPSPWLQGVSDPYDGANGADPYHSWGKQLSVSAAAGKLRGLVKGALIGIQVTKEGVSPRIISAEIAGSRGRTTVSGAVLADRFGLPSTDAAFTTITTSGAHGRLSGSIFPAASPDLGLSLQSYAGGRWTTVEQLQVTGNGGYAASVPAAGRYRVVDGSFSGPAVTAH